MAMTVNSVSFKKTLVCATGQASRESGYSRLIVNKRESKFVLLKFTELNYKSQNFDHLSISNN